jgi:hypothetical protein
MWCIPTYVLCSCSISPTGDYNLNLELHLGASGPDTARYTGTMIEQTGHIILR